LLRFWRHGLWESDLQVVIDVEGDAEVERLFDKGFGLGEVAESRLDVVRMDAEGESHAPPFGFIEAFAQGHGVAPSK
jgi:hypothetical protein